ncbi:hypothetical protein M2451_001773 [Dysgonomonas sp. PFB1-18]|uniref:nitrous oxide-stimulated promoter family protein n=1 Tax=unclassified Dysgonomonas TaxID=2630389 RepID=UPI002476FC3C|nr:MULTISPECIES: nitrous oxide-stimulated promoter family protein [unclassified Dysgonomonas]MDH6309202.1 hypothetical protein [Dysgonomonas sp. PF1-14]MDH6338918.1 hypothetical protein [Dysgonomonas sp. PF1-16]MDH6380451.1 hypothetical protein [Dysgonomonas sp. PFB1-18]MDH6397746.1 hypothetical protein [Dysgonomonas sp. PF1-23]
MNNAEKKTVAKMIRIYCAAKHGGKDGLCLECTALNEYAEKRLERCTYGEDKPSCQKCPIHCYKPDMKARIQEVMRFSGPRMLFRSPLMALHHLWKNFRS